MNWQPPFPNWQPPPPPPRPQGPGGPGGQGMGGPGPGGAGATTVAEEAEELTLYELLQVDRNAHPTIIRYSYRFLAAMYHPDNSETGDSEKFRIITEAWKTLSDEGKRAAYDMTLGVKEQAKAPGSAPKVQRQSEFGRDALPEFIKTTVSWNEIELRLAVLQILLAARKRRPTTGGASGKMLMDCLNLDVITEIEFALWYLREKGLIEVGERVFMITAQGLDYLTEQLSKTAILDGGSATEQKVTTAVNAGLPATLRQNPVS